MDKEKKLFYYGFVRLSTISLYRCTYDHNICIVNINIIKIYPIFTICQCCRLNIFVGKCRECVHVYFKTKPTALHSIIYSYPLLERLPHFYCDIRKIP